MIRIAPRLTAALLSAAAALAMVSISSSATATTRPSQAPLAAQLSRRVESASTSQARYQALLAVMHALRIGVYTSAGRTIARGAESGPRDLYFYDFELRALAAELARGSTSTVADLATELTHAGVTVHGKPVTATALDSAIAAGTHEAQGRPRSPLSLAPLLFRDLGLQHAGLDPLQRTILLADVAVAGGPLPSRGGTLGAEKAKCQIDDLTPDPHRAGYRIGKWLAEKGFAVGETIVKSVWELFHAVVLAHAIDFHEVTNGEVTSTHYGPAGDHPGSTGDHVPGQKLVYTVEVDMTADLARTEPDFVSCGELLGLKIPPPGPVPGVQIQWRPLLLDGFQRLIKHGTASYAETTDSHGQADLRFTPNDEAIPGFGELRTETGTLRPGASVLDAFGNGPAGLIEEVAPLSVTLRAWSVEWHQPRGFKFAMLDYPEAPSPMFTFQRARFGVEAHVCGNDPYAKPWSGTWHQMVTEQDGRQHDDAHGKTFDNWVFEPGVTSSPLPPYYSSTDREPGDQVEAALIRGTPPDPPLMARLRVRQTPPEYGGDPFYTTTVPVEEDTSCPET